MIVIWRIKSARYYFHECLCPSLVGYFNSSLGSEMQIESCSLSFLMWQFNRMLSKGAGSNSGGFCLG